MNQHVELQEDFKSLIRGVIERSGASLTNSAADVAEYAAGRSAYLATLVGQPGFEEAVVAERQSVMLHAGIAAVNEADQIDAALAGVIEGALGMASRSLARMSG